MLSSAGFDSHLISAGEGLVFSDFSLAISDLSLLISYL
jgi:hypothetical protein